MAKSNATKTKPIDRGLVLTIHNKHFEGCGLPPELTNRSDTGGRRYFGYYENVQGEQTVFVYDYTVERGRIYCGDAGWASSYDVMEIEPERLPMPAKDVAKVKATDPSLFLPNGNLLGTPGLVLGRDEKRWLESCWLTVQHYRKYRDERKAKSAKPE